MNGKAKKSLKKLVCAGISILFITASAEATLVDSNSSIVIDNIEYYTQTNKAVYDLGESVEMLHRVTNLKDEPLTFVFAYQQQCFFEILDGETRIWGWPKLVSPALSSFTLQPGEFKEFLKDWDMMNDNGTLEPGDDFFVSPGIYDVSGQLTGSSTSGIIPESVSVPIQIIPEPCSLVLLGAGFMGIILARKKGRFHYERLMTASCRNEVKEMIGRIKSKACLVISIFLLGLACSTAAGRTIYVDADAPADFNNIQAAINDSNDGDTIIVVEGRYFENINFNGRNITLTSTDPCNPEVVAATIIDGNQNGSVVTFKSEEDANCVLNGFTITNGCAEVGGGISCRGPLYPPLPPGEPMPECNFPGPTITNCIINNNSAILGGGMYNNRASCPILTNCTFTENSAIGTHMSGGAGGGMCNYYSSPELKECTFTDNSAVGGRFSGWGGGMYNYESGPILTNCTINENSADDGGGIFNIGDPMSVSKSTPTLTNCTFNGNSAHHSGGGMFNLESSPSLTNCTFKENLAQHSGGGVFNLESSPSLTNCTFKENLAQYSGGGMYSGGDPMSISKSTFLLTNCTFNGNLAGERGGGMLNDHSSPTLSNCDFNENSAFLGGGILNYGKAILANCIFTRNTADHGGGMANESSFVTVTNPTLNNCTFNENSANREGGGMLNNYSSPTVTNCTFSGNSAVGTDRYYGYGGGMANEQSDPILTSCAFFKNKAGYYGGAIYSNGKPEITNCIISENSAINGGGLNGCDGPISNSTIVRNHASGGGGLSFCKGPITNCIVSDNTSIDWAGGLLHCDGPVTNCIITANKGDALFGCDGSITNCNIVGNIGSGLFACSNLITSCIIWDNSDIQIEHSAQPTYSNIQGGWPGEGNIDAGPCFVQPGYWDANGTPNNPNDDFWIDGDHHLLSESPCIDAGDPNYIAEPNATDLDGRPRVINGRIDMGAYEYSPPIPTNVRIVPRTISLSSSGKWIAVFLLLPEDYKVTDIDPNSVLLEGEIEPERFWTIEYFQIAIAKFSREQVKNILSVGQTELTITGRLVDGTVFEGTDTIRGTDKVSRKSPK